MKSKEINWSEIYKKESGKLLAILRRYVYDIQIAEDILHESFIKAMESVDSYKSIGAFEAWLKQITIYSALDYLRKNKKQTFLDIEDVNIAEESSENHTNPNSKSIIRNASFSKSDLLEVIDSLPIQQKTIFNLYVIDEYSHKEISNKLDISESVSKTTLSRSRKRIQELLYQKAVSMETNKKKRQGAFVLLSAVGISEMNAMDRLFQDAFKNDNIQPKNNKPLFKKNLEQGKPILIKPSVRLFKTSAIIFIGASTVACVTYCFISSNTNEAEAKLPIENRVFSTKPKTNNIKSLNTVDIKNSEESETNLKTQIKKVETTKTEKENNLQKNNTLTLETKSKPDTSQTIKTAVNDNDTTKQTVLQKKVIFKKKVYIKQQ